MNQRVQAPTERSKKFHALDPGPSGPRPETSRGSRHHRRVAPEQRTDGRPRPENQTRRQARRSLAGGGRDIGGREDGRTVHCNAWRKEESAEKKKGPGEGSVTIETVRHESSTGWRAPRRGSVLLPRGLDTVFAAQAGDAGKHHHEGAGSFSTLLSQYGKVPRMPQSPNCGDFTHNQEPFLKMARRPSTDQGTVSSRISASG